jgi:predicted NAD/FAD-dependent oxidoreductase
MSTRRAEPYFFDHGAQYFTARTEPFQQFIQPLIARGVIERWNPYYVKFAGDQMIARKDWRNDEPRYVGVPGMNSMAKHLAKNFKIKLNTKITVLQQHKKWQLYDELGTHYKDFDWIISTAPACDTVELFPLNFEHYAKIKAIEMHPCFSLMLGFSKVLALDFQAAHISNADLSWLAVNSHKPGRAKPFTLVAFSSVEYATKHIDGDRDKIMQHLCFATTRIIGHDVNIADHKAVHGWRFANNAKREPGSIFIDHNLQLAACGDWCFGGRVEWAFMSAYQLAKKIKEIIL